MSNAGTYEISTWDASEANVPQAEEKPMLRRPYKPGEQPQNPAAVGWPMTSPNSNQSPHSFTFNPNAKSFTPSSNAAAFTPKSTGVYNQQQLPVAGDPSLVHVPSMAPIQSVLPARSAAPGPSVVPVPSEHYEHGGGQDYALPTSTDKRNVDVVSNVKDVLNLMSANPGCFDEYIEQLVHALNTNPVDRHQLDNLTEFIYEQAIFDTNFTYTAAKVCNCLCKGLAVKPGLDTFRDNLMTKLQKEFKEREASLNDPTLVERLHRFTMFIAELFLNIEVMINNKPSKAVILRRALHGLMEALLKYLNDDNTRLLIKLLKLTGAQADDFDKESGNNSNLKSLFSTIRNIVLDSKLTRNTRQMLLDLIELRASNWGRDTSPPTAPKLYSNSASGDSAVGVTNANDFTFYSPDGRVISEEEACSIYVNENDFNNMDEYFNKWSLGNNEKSHNYPDDDFYYGSDSSSYHDQGPDFFDDEVAAAFDEYLMMKDNR